MVIAALTGRTILANHIEECYGCGRQEVCQSDRRLMAWCHEPGCIKDHLCDECRLRCESCGAVICSEHSTVFCDEGPTIPGTMSDGEDHTLCSGCADIEERRDRS